MANTTNLNLTKLAGTEKLKTFPSPYNDNMDAIDGAFGAGFGVSGKPTVNAEINSLADGLAIISNNNTHAAITAGQFVYVRGHGSLSDGLYVATSNISANGTLSGSNLTADTSGGLNSVYASLNSNITNLNNAITRNDGYAPIAGSKYNLESGTIRIFGLCAFLSCHVIALESATTTDIIATVPSAVLPSTITPCVTLFFKRGTGSPGMFGGYCSINTNGEIKQTAVGTVQANDEFFIQILYKTI